MFDPEHPEKSLVLKDGRVVEVTDLDVEQGQHTEMTGLEEETEETVTNNTADNIEYRRASKEAEEKQEEEHEKQETPEEQEEKENSKVRGSLGLRP